MATHFNILAEKSHGQRSLMGYSSKGCKESDMTEQLCMHYTLAFYLLYISIPISISIYLYLYISISIYISLAFLSSKLSIPTVCILLSKFWHCNLIWPKLFPQFI